VKKTIIVEFGALLESLKCVGLNEGYLEIFRPKVLEI
jgi:hypothetical protein